MTSSNYSGKDLYKVLDISPNVGISEIKSTIGELLRIFHPDKAVPELSEHAENITKELILAKECLLDKARRSEYDASYNDKKKQGYFEPSAMDEFRELFGIQPRTLLDRLKGPLVPKDYIN